MMYTAVKSYKATKDDEISVTIGSVVEVLQKSQNGWWLIRYSIFLNQDMMVVWKPTTECQRNFC